MKKHRPNHQQTNTTTEERWQSQAPSTLEEAAEQSPWQRNPGGCPQLPIPSAAWARSEPQRPLDAFVAQTSNQLKVIGDFCDVKWFTEFQVLRCLGQYDSVCPICLKNVVYLVYQHTIQLPILRPLGYPDHQALATHCH